jgi:death-on-curing protein
MAPVVHLTADQVLDLHAEALTLGGRTGVRSVHLLHSAIGQVEQTAFGEDAYPTVPEKAAAYAYFLARNHPFVDGNKRTAEAAMLVFLELNGFDFIEDQDRMADMFERLAADDVDQEQFFDWVRERTRTRDAGD